MKNQEIVNIGISLKDVKSTLLEIHKTMSDIEDRYEISGEDPNYVQKGEQLVVRVFKEHFYTPNQEKYNECKNNLMEAKGSIKADFAAIFESFDLAYCPFCSLKIVLRS